MIFLDTSAIYAWADKADPNHQIAIDRLQEIIDREEDLLTHNYVVLESVALLQSRLGQAAATKFLKDTVAFTMEWVDRDLHAAGVREFEKSGKRRVSLVDHISFLVMKRKNLRTAFAFDADFKTAGLQLFEP